MPNGVFILANEQDVLRTKWLNWQKRELLVWLDGIDKELDEICGRGKWVDPLTAKDELMCPE